MTSVQKPIGIIGAMDQEVALLREQLQNRQELSLGGMTFYEGELDGLPVVLQKCGIGKVNAAIGTTILIDRFQPSAILNTGSAGGLDNSLNVGDVVISTEVRHHDVDVTAFGYEYGQVPQLPAAFMPCDKLVQQAVLALSNLNTQTSKNYRIYRGQILTGDSFMQCADRVAQTRERFPNSAAVEMEAAAIAQVCHQMDVPFLIIRSLSDIAGKESNVSFEQFLDTAATHSADMILAIVRQISNEPSQPPVAA
ncbi:5'-methylthioadenosine/S-adenosylhomocysteine nucleosidase [Parendozoicomonas sp. Alg238-R29]|uniref:5'-methylthioadenosine/S-adenosylhomocysteine nucleosidase n=1 Tax=Parendozoicomonas sp. Alg238-R29 TaxID=2993446 RepID=UPI00248D5015|nr:5'-methylthioadenosine/S-adenosylhomocysteine nucleosidase [Parendozoicomonas sp. Alg238-R29]